jgi:hypothetical protein
MDLNIPHSYTALEKPDETSELIKILSISPCTCCEFSVVSLEEHPEFTILSYMWGTSTDKDVIDIDGKDNLNLSEPRKCVTGHLSPVKR